MALADIENYRLVDGTKLDNLPADVSQELADIAEEQVAQDNAIALNTAKATNATHTWEVTGSGVLTVWPTAISNKATLTIDGTEEVLVNDGGTLKKTTTQDIADLGWGWGGSGDVVWPASAVDENIAGFDSTTGKIIKDLGINKSAIVANTSNRNLSKVSSNDTTGGYLNGKLVSGANITFVEWSDWGDETLTISASGAWDTINNYSSLWDEQVFNPDAWQVTADTGDFTMSSANNIAHITLDGVQLWPTEYSQASSVVTITPINWFSSTDQQIIVQQDTFATSSTWVITWFTQKSAAYTITNSDHTVECTENTFTVTLPTAISQAGRIFVVFNSGFGIITVDGTGSQTINGDLTQILSTNESITVQSNGSNWILI